MRRERGSTLISAVLLAAGESRRMGEFKQLLPFAGKTFVECCVDNLLASDIDEVVVVTGHREADLRRVIGDRSVRFVYNPDYPSGMSSSIKQGVKSLSKSARACLIALADQPKVGVDVINHLIEKYEDEHPLIVIPTYEGRNGHPILLDLSLREEILAMDFEQGLRQVVHARSEATARVEVSSRAVLEDFDVPEDYHRLLNQ